VTVTTYPSNFRFVVVGAITVLLCPGLSSAATPSWKLRCDALFAANAEPAADSLARRPLQSNLKAEYVFAKEADLRELFPRETMKSPRELFPDGMIDRLPVLRAGIFVPKARVAGEIKGREMAVARVLPSDSPVKIDGVVHDVYLARVLSYRKMPRDFVASDSVKVWINRRNRMTWKKVEKIEIDIQISQSDRDAFDNYQTHPRLLEEALELPSSIPVDSVVRKVVLPDSRDLAGVLTVFVQTSATSVSIFEFKFSDLKTWEEIKDRPRDMRTPMRLVRTITVQEFEGS
jgi:hypothetical protein